MTYTANKYKDEDQSTVQNVVSCDYAYTSNHNDCNPDSWGHNQSRMHYNGAGWSTVGAHHWVRDVNWVPSATPLQDESAKLDAAIQIMAGSDICVRGGVIDSTSTPHSAAGGTAASTALAGGDTKTDALLVWPITGSNFRLKVGGEMDINMIHDNPTAQPRYTSAGFPSLTTNRKVQDVNGNMYLNAGSTLFTVVELSNLYAASLSKDPQDTRYKERCPWGI